MLFIESCLIPIKKESIEIRTEQLAGIETLLAKDTLPHMATIDFGDIVAIVYGEDIVAELRGFLHSKAKHRLGQLNDFPRESQP